MQAQAKRHTRTLILAGLVLASPAALAAGSADDVVAGISQTASTVANSTGRFLGDTALTTQVRAALLEDKQVPSLHIAVSTKDRVVTLTGSVGTQQQAWRASETAGKVPGVKLVDNQLAIQADHDATGKKIDHVITYLSDAAITNQIRAMLLAARDVPSSRISVHTEEGVVTLSGYVGDKAQGERAANIARSVKDVKEVRNTLAVL